MSLKFFFLSLFLKAASGKDELELLFFGRGFCVCVLFLFVFCLLFICLLICFRVFEFGEFLHQGLSLEGLLSIYFVVLQDMSASRFGEDTDPAGIVSLGPDVVTVARLSAELFSLGVITRSPPQSPCLV